MYGIDEVCGVFADAVVLNEREELLFMSIWGRDTAIQELLGRLSLRVKDGGIDCLTLMDGQSLVARCWVGNDSRLEKLMGRMPKENLFGAMTQIWLFDRLMVEPDRVNRRAMLFIRMGIDQEIETRLRIWEMVKDLCHLPLLDNWMDAVMKCFLDNGWICCLSQCEVKGYAAECWSISLGDTQDIEIAISELVKNQQLTLSAA